MMKNILSTLSLATVLSVGSMLFTGCGTPQAVKSTESAVSSMDDVQQTLEDGNKQITAVMTALNEVGENVARDGKKSYKNFSSEVDKLDKIAETARNQADKMRANAEQHYAQWQQEIGTISNTALKDQSEARRAGMQQEFAGLKESMAGLKNTFRPFMNDMRDLQTFLGADLSASGYTAAESIVSELKSEAVYVQRQLESVVAKLNTLRGSMAAAGQ